MFVSVTNIPLASRSTSSTRSFTSSSNVNASTVTHRRKYRDPYAIAQSKARKAANISRQEVLKKERAAALGDPVRGVTTPYLQSFDTAISPESSEEATSTKTRISESPDQDSPGPQTSKDEHLNFFLSKSELEQGVKHTQWLTTPSKDTDQTSAWSATDERTPEEQQADRQAQAENANEALRRISSLSLGNSNDRLRVNIRRCISDFGRHNTDKTLDPKPASMQGRPKTALPATPRVGADTGSSEVQIAILTAKIRTLADFLQGRGRTDKMNKRNLRLLVHRRQKLLRYLERKERGGPRFRHVVETLGLTEGTWKGEISL